MKKVLLVCALFTCVVVLNGCNFSSLSRSSKAPALPVPLSSSSSSTAAASDASIRDENSIPEPEFSYSGVYICDKEGSASPEYYPTITLNDDNSFVFTVNLLEGMGHMYGTYTVENGYLDMTVTSKDFSGFRGDDIESFHMSIQDENTLVYSGGFVGLTDDGDVFRR